MFNRFLFRKTDNSTLIIFRIFFGILVSLECYGAIVTGWVKRTLIDPKINFSFIGFEWIQPLPGNGMYFYFLAMGTLGVFIALGYKYRFSIISFTLLWTAVYLMQKTAYNNHYYLLILISFIMVFLPAHKSYSIDSKQNPLLRDDTMYSYVKWVFVLQLFLVYTYASIAKMYGDWLDFSIIRMLLMDKVDYPIIGGLLQESWVHKIIGTVGILFDLLIVPALLWKPSRKYAFCLSIFFHLFNSIVFQIGIFPYLSLAFTVFFFEPKTIRNIFFKKKVLYEENGDEMAPNRNWLLLGWGCYFIIQSLLPIRHHFLADNVLWTEEGHRMSWRMMLRSRGGIIKFRIVNKENNESKMVNLDDYLTKKQKAKVASYPDFTWQFAQYLKKKHAEKGENIEVYVKSSVSVNGRPYRLFIDPKTDLADEPWQPYSHHKWILPSKSAISNQD